MRIADFDFTLPSRLIATHPPDERRGSRLLCVDGETSRIDDRQFADLPTLLRESDLLVFNDTRVIKARLRGHKETGGKVEILIERVLTEETASAHIRASKSPRPGLRLELPDACRATVTSREGELYVLTFDRAIATYLEHFGEVPLPPYLGRDAETADSERYQTVYARRDGAVAAPTAGLHFDQEMLAELERRGVRSCFVTLHVGAGTFQSLRESNVEENRLHAERVQVTEGTVAAVNAARAVGGRVIAVGTTSVRALEAAAASGKLKPIDGETELFILPGYQFNAVDCLITNFHLPMSSLLMLVAAFAGTGLVQDAYRHAVEREYRFFSYGDSMFVVPPDRRSK